jgi:hypothetical protein
MDARKRQARIAGILYLLLALPAPFGLLYVPGQIMVPRDATATADHLRASATLVRLGIGAELFNQTMAVFLVLALYRLFKPVSETLSRQLVVLGALVSVPIVFVNILNEIAALTIVSGAGYLSVFDARQLDALAYLFYRLHGQGLIVAAIFWGLWLFPFGLLVIRSGFIPRAIGVLLLVAGAGYVASSFASLIVPQYASAVGQVAGLLEVCELPIIFWLAIWGARDSPQSARLSPQSAVSAL